VAGTNQTSDDGDIDVLYVHLYNDPNTDQIRVNLFNALNQLRARVMNTPEDRAGFLTDDHLVQQPLVDLATTAGKDTSRAIHPLLRRVFSVNLDAYADDYLAARQQAHSRYLHVKFNCTNWILLAAQT